MKTISIVEIKNEEPTYIFVDRIKCFRKRNVPQLPKMVTEIEYVLFDGSIVKLWTYEALNDVLKKICPEAFE